MTQQVESAVLGISISEPPDLVGRGLAEIHLLHAFIEIVRHVLAAGGSIAYGGDLRPGGYTESLFDLLRSYERRDRPGPERVFNFLAWPDWMALTAADRADKGRIGTLTQVGTPSGAPATLAEPRKRSPEERVWFSASLTAMRQEMTRITTARLILGGRVFGQQGLLPGVLEEAALAVQAGQPLYPIGGFGGAGQLVAQLMNGQVPDEVTLEYQIAHTPGYQDLLDAAHRMGFEAALQSAVDVLSGSRNRMQNGLDAEENQRLATSDDVDEVIVLVLRGLRQAGGGSGYPPPSTFG